MSEIAKGHIYADRAGRERLVHDTGVHLRPYSCHMPYMGVEYSYTDDPEHRKYRGLLSEFATNSTWLVGKA